MSSPFQTLRDAVDAAHKRLVLTEDDKAFLVPVEYWRAIMDATGLVDAEPAVIDADLADLRAQLARSEARQAKLERRFAAIQTMASCEGLDVCDVHGTPLEHYVDAHCPECTKEGERG